MPELLFVFKKSPQTNLETFVSWCAGPMVHVDVVVGGFMFTSYMFERFSLNKLPLYHPSTHECLALQVTEQVHNAVQDILTRWVDKQIPYNYSDVFHLIVPSSADQVQDVESEEQIETLFCSQAATLAVRLASSNGFLQDLNSRTTTPTMLFEALKPHCEFRDVMSL